EDGIRDATVTGVQTCALPIFRLRSGEFLIRALSTAGNFLFTRYSAWKGTHPMSGGVGRVKRDSDRDYLTLRRRFFGFDLAPLPRSEERRVGNESRSRWSRAA